MKVIFLIQGRDEGQGLTDETPGLMVTVRMPGQKNTGGLETQAERSCVWFSSELCAWNHAA